MFQCNTLYCNTKCRLCIHLAKGYIPPCICKLYLKKVSGHSVKVYVFTSVPSDMILVLLAHELIIVW